MIKGRIKPSSYGVYKGYITRHISSYFMDIKCKQLTLEIVQGFIDEKIKDGLSAATIHHIFSYLKRSLSDIAAHGIFDITLPKRIKNNTRAFSIGEQKRLERSAAHSDDIDFISIKLALNMGLRIGEICGLRWDDIDFESGMLHVQRTVQRIKNPDYTGDNLSNTPKTITTCLSPKSDASVRSIPIPEFLQAILIKHRNRSNDTNGYVISMGGSFVEPRCIQYRFRKLLKSANIKNVNFHITRHTFATRALEFGFDIKTLSEILGHSSATVTLKTYAHTMNEQKIRCMELLNQKYEFAS